jgi:hypothetical protein
MRSHLWINIYFYSFLAFLLFLFIYTYAYADPLPNLQLTPGLARTDLTQDQICTIKWGKDERAVTQAMKTQIFKEYNYPQLNKDPRCPCEIDHLISRELGGADDVRNLWVQPYTGDWNAHMKDRLENRLHVDICNGTVALKDAQANIVKDWVTLYQSYFGAVQHN